MERYKTLSSQFSLSNYFWTEVELDTSYISVLAWSNIKLLAEFAYCKFLI